MEIYRLYIIYITTERTKSANQICLAKDTFTLGGMLRFAKINLSHMILDNKLNWCHKQ